MSPGCVQVEREGLLYWSWRAYGVLRRSQRRGGMMVMAGFPTTVARGTARTQRGAERKGQRALRRWT